MPETIKSFIDKLQSDGVQAGQQAAEAIRVEAEAEARQKIQQAEEQARKIIERSHGESESLRTRVQTEVELAARDAVLRLQETIIHALQGVLSAAVKEKLSDAEFLKEILHTVVLQYAKADAEGQVGMTINVPEEMKRQLADWALETLQASSREAGKEVDLHGSLSQAGFEYRVAEGTVEVTVDSTVAILLDLVGPEVGKIVKRAIQDKEKTPDS